jgi:serine/threonine protein kinase
MLLRRETNGEVIALQNARVLGGGGEGKVYSLNSRLAAKLYRTPTDGRKLRAMLANPPVEVGHEERTAIAWPLDLLVDAQGAVHGFLMPRVTAVRPLVNFYNPRTRIEQSPLFNYRYLHRAARNLAAAVQRLHERGYVIGDINESNILATDTALVTLVDTDSFQVQDGETIYRCRVGRPEFTPPELQGRDLGEVDRTPDQDRFGLAVLLFQLLMEGTHPFAGVFEGEGEPPSISKRIALGWFPYTSKSCPIQPSPLSPPFTLLHPELRALFVRCFVDGQTNPAARPDAKTWQQALEIAEAALAVCSTNLQHLHGEHLETCPWCERTQLLKGRDPFPAGPIRVQPQGSTTPQTAPPPISTPAKRKTGTRLKIFAAIVMVFLVFTYLVIDDTGMLAPSFSGYADRLVFSPDSKYAAVAWDDGVDILDPHVMKWLKHLPGRSAYPVGFSRDGKTLLVYDGNPEEEFEAWNVATGTLILDGQAPENSSSYYLPNQVSPDGKYDLTKKQIGKLFGEVKEEIWLIEAKTGKFIRELTGKYPGAKTIGFGPDSGTLLVVKEIPKNVVEVRDLKTDALLRTFDLGPSDIFSISRNLDGSLIATCAYNRLITIWDTRKGRRVRYYWIGELIKHMTFSPDGKVLAIGYNGGGLYSSIKFLKVR